MHIDALFTNKAQMNKVLVQRLLINMWALLHFWNVSRLPLQVLSRMSSKFYCRSGWSGAMPIFPSSFNFRVIETWKDYVDPAGAAATGATLTTQWSCRIRHPLTIITSGRLCTSMRLGAAWRLIAGGLCMVPALPGQPRCPVVKVTSTWHYMPLHDDSLHEITCYYMHVIACNYMLLHACNSL